MTSDPARLTPLGKSQIEERIADIRSRRIPDVVELLAEDRTDEWAQMELDRLLEETVMLDALVAECEVIADTTHAFDGRVTLGMRVRVGMPDGAEEWVRPVHPAEAFLDDERISQESPLARALLGARASHLVWVNSPSGLWAARVLEVDPRVHDAE